MLLTFQERIEKWYPEICSNIYCGASIPSEWEDIVVGALEELRHYPVSVAQIKSKFGGLRLYIDFKDCATSDDIRHAYWAIHEAEDAVAVVEKRRHT